MKLSIILLDWSVREHFQSLHFLQKQSVPRSSYELIWVELFDKEDEFAKQICDQHICCHQKGIYNKHKAYNAGILAARGELICICDSDAVYPYNFVEKILQHFYHGQEIPQRSILQIYQRRTNTVWPGLDAIKLESIEHDFQWKTWENVCACGIFRREDLIAIGGIDEHRSYRGYFCGYNETVNRMVNIGIPEYWMPDTELTIWHFQHLRPTDAEYGLQMLSIIREIQGEEIDHHAFYSIECMVSGRFHPLRENQAIKKLRLERRKIGSKFEAKYKSPELFRKHRLKRYTFGWFYRLKAVWKLLMYWKAMTMQNLIGKERYELLKKKIMRN